MVCLLSLDDSDQLKNDIVDYMKTGSEPSSFEENLRKLIEKFEDFENRFYCTLCFIVSDAFIKARRWGASKKHIQKVLVSICVLSKISTKDVCLGTIHLNIVSMAIFAILINSATN